MGPHKGQRSGLGHIIHVPGTSLQLPQLAIEVTQLQARLLGVTCLHQAGPGHQQHQGVRKGVKAGSSFWAQTAQGPCSYSHMNLPLSDSKNRFSARSWGAGGSEHLADSAVLVVQCSGRLNSPNICK